MNYHRRFVIAFILLAAVSAVVVAVFTSGGFMGSAINPDRYVEQVFTAADVDKDITYASAMNEKGQDEQLKLDVYQPSGDKQKLRPAIVWIHGGSFSGGSKDNGMAQMLAEDFALRGYVTLSINYRLREQPLADLFATVRDCTDDAAQAVDWLVANSSQYGVDTGRIAIGGYSAGAITATNLVYKDGENANWQKSSIFAVIDLSGGNVELGIPDQTDPPCLIVKGKLDSVLPYKLSVALSEKLTAAGIENELYALDKAGHDILPHYDEVVNLISTYLFNLLNNKN